jgi:hypothetical protein
MDLLNNVGVIYCKFTTKIYNLFHQIQDLLDNKVNKNR